MTSQKKILALASVFVLIVIYGVAAPGDDALASALFTIIAVVTLYLIVASLKNPAYDVYLQRFVVGVAVFLVVLYSIPMSVWRSVGLAD